VVTITVIALNEILIILFAAILSVPLVQLIQLVSKKLHLHYALSYILCWALLLLFMGLLIYLGADSIRNQFTSFTEASSSLSLEEVTLPAWVPTDVVTELRNINVINYIQNNFSNSSVNQTVSSIFSGLTGVVVFVALIAFITFDPRQYSSTLTTLIPKQYQKTVTSAKQNVTRVLDRWILGRLVSMLVVAILTYIGLLILGIEFALVLALLAGLLSFIPNLGPLLSVVPALLIGLQSGISTVVWIIALYALIQFVESYLITPFVQKKAVAIEPAFLLAVQIVFAAVFGFMGLLLAGPLLAVAIGLRNPTEEVSSS
jgi:predicted PurR-regulated permease PerM